MHILTLSREQIQIIAAALHEAPYRLAAPVLVEIDRQVSAEAERAKAEPGA